LRDCAVHCVHCGIRFLTDPRNVRRDDLRCPFGCRAHHRRQRSNQRSAAYYSTPEGKRQKKLLNGRRRRGSREMSGKDAQPRLEEAIAPPGCCDSSLPGESPSKAELPLEGLVLDESSVAHSPLLWYVQLLVRLIEGVPFSRPQIVDLLCRAMRQRSMDGRRKLDYVLRFLHQHPP